MPFGGKITLTGESEYRKAIQSITKDLSNMSSQLKAQTADFSSNDKSIKNTAQVSKELNESLKTQSAELAKAKSSYAQYSVAVQAQQTKHNQLSKEYKNAVLELERIKQTSGETSEEYKKQAQVVDKLGQELADSTEELNESKSAMSALKSEINNSQKAINNTEKAIDELGEETEDAGESAKKAGDGFTVMKGVLANLATQAINSAVNGLKNLGGAFVNVGKQAMGNFAEFEQLEGGVRKLFGEETSKTVIENANKAFKTAGMSANEYMDTVTSFSASLISGLNGDTAKASKLADEAIRDMSDNANTFGTDISSIQNAYQGFAKGNFTMLDNLKLGYGGTKTEMLRLVKDAGVVEDSVKSIDDVSFDQIIEAIHITQENMKITGTTADEASRTIQGATGSVKSAWQNMLTGMADENANFEELATNFIGTLITPDGQGGVLGTIIPRVSQVITGMSEALEAMLPQLIQSVVPLIEQNLPIIMEAIQNALTTILGVLPEVIPVIADLIPQIVETMMTLLPQLVDAGIEIIISLIEGLTDAIPQLLKMLPTIIKKTVDTLMNNLPLIIKAGVELLVALIKGLAEALPQLIDYIPEIVSTIVNVVMENLDLIIDSAIQIMLALIDGLIQSLPKLIAMIPKIIMAIVTGLINNLPKIIEGGVKIVTSLVTGLGKSISKVIQKAKEIGETILNKLKEFPSKMIEVGKNLVTGIWNGIKNAKDWVLDKIKGFGESILNGIKSFFGINSPSRVMRDQVGKNLALGLIEGWEKEKPKVENSVRKMEQLFIKMSEKKINEERKAHKATLADEAVYWQKLTDTFKKGSKEYSYASKQLKATKQEIKASVSGLTEGMTSSIAKINDELAKNVKALKDSYKKAVSARSEDIMRSLKLFDEVKFDEAIGKSDLMKNLKDQVNGLKEWDKTLNSLRGKISNKALMEELENEDVTSLKTLQALNSMSKKELKEYETLYGKKQKLSESHAKSQYADTLKETEKKIADLEEKATLKVEKITKAYTKQLEKLGVSGAKKGSMVGKALADGIGDGFSKGMKGVTGKTKKELQDLLDSIKKKLKIASPSKLYRDEIGENLAKGIGVGFEDGMKSVTSEMQNALPTNLDISNASRVQDDSSKMVSAFKEALMQMKIELDDDEVGRFIDKTVTRLVYA